MKKAALGMAFFLGAALATGVLAEDILIDAMPFPDEVLAQAAAQPAANTGWRTENGHQVWYENGVKQGTTGRGKEIYDPASDAWYWLDAPTGAKAVGKDVYQESDAGPWADRADGTGKWVRYDADGHMVKGWQDTAAGRYYFDLTYGTMAKGFATIDGREYYFDPATGVLQYEVGPVPANGWKTIDGKDYWYENGMRQGYSVDASYRGKEIFDPASNAWYWLDNVQGGAKAVSKDVYQESDAGPWADRADGTGKWVRYDADGHMIKGWQQTPVGKYYFDLIYGTMAKGRAQIDGIWYEFDPNTGVCREEAPHPEPSQQPQTATVYWTPNGKSYHVSRDCVALKRSSTVLSGTKAEAAAAGKSDPCNLCVK